MYVPVVTLNTTNNNKLSDLLKKSFKRSVFWNEYKSKRQTVTQEQNDNNFKIWVVDSSFQGVNRLFAMGFNDTVGNDDRVQRTDHKKIFFTKNRYGLQRINWGRNFYYQKISDELRKYDEVRNIMSGKGEDYTTGSLLDYAYYKKY